MANTSHPIVIIGGGFAGVYTAKYLHRRLPPGWDVILFSQENHFIFTPLLGDVVGSSINPMHVVCPVRQMVPGVHCRTAALSGIDMADRCVTYTTAAGRPERQTFEHLVLACGSVVNLDIIPGMAAHGWPLKTMGDALMLRNHLIGLLEKAEVETNPVRKRRLLAIVVVGGGYSGVEVTGEVADLLKESARFYSTIKSSDIRVTLLEGQGRILPELPESLAAFAQRKMTRRGIEVRVKALAQSVTAEGVRLQDGDEIEAATIICTIGTAINPLIRALNLPRLHNRIKTGADMRVEGHANLWAVGDCAAIPNAYDGKMSAPTAQVAVRQARHLAGNILRAIDNRPTTPFAFKPLGMLASIGNRKAVGLIFGLKLSGFLAWFIWRGVYLSKMPTLARKIQIAFDWAWQLIFPRDIVQLALDQTERLGHAHFEPGQFVFHKGEPGDNFYIIQRGRAGAYLDEAAPPVTILGAGDHFGEGALLRPAPRSASIKAEVPLDVLVLSRASFGQLTTHLDILRAALQRSAQGSRSAAELLRMAQHNPRLNTILVGEVMSHPLQTLPVDLTFAEALQRSREQGKGAYPVVDGQGRMVGICTRTDFYKAVQELRPPQTPLAEIMHKPVLTVRRSDSLATALLVFLRAPIKRVVVVADDAPEKPVGMVTLFDVVGVVSEGLGGGQRI
jgi:NADH:ubiquinone reductase (H+-translocating)